jgi:hypothetical protein
MVGSPDDYGMVGSGTQINVSASRKSMIVNGANPSLSRRAPIKVNDELFKINVQGQSGALGTNTSSSPSIIRIQAAEDFTTTKTGARFEVLTPDIGTNAINTRISTSSDLTTFKSNSHIWNHTDGSILFKVDKDYADFASDNITFKDSNGNNNLVFDTNGNAIFGRGNTTLTSGNMTLGSGNLTLTSGVFYGDGSGLTNLSASNPFNQTLNTNSNVTFTSVSGNGSGLTNLPNRFNQELNTNSAVTFGNITTNGNIQLNSGGVNIKSAWNSNTPLYIQSTLLDTNYQAGATIGFQTNYKASEGASTYTIPQAGWSIGKFAFQGSANTSGTNDVLAGQLLCQAQGTWNSGNHGTKFLFTANRENQTWQNGSRVVLTLSPELAQFQADELNFNADDNTQRFSVTSVRAKSHLPFELPSYTATAANAITGAVGRMICITNSSSGSNPNGMIAFWDTTNSRWSYIHDNSAV